jgi:hypothetical protein
MYESESAEAGMPFADCATRHLCADLYFCQTKRIGCSSGMSYGDELFCRHPDKKSSCVQPMVADALNNNRQVVPREEM